MSFEVAAGGAGRGLEVVAHVYLVAYLQPVFLPCRLHELPVALCARGRGDVLQAALYDAEVLHVLRHMLFLQYALDGGEDARGTLYVEERVALVVHVAHQLAVKPFAHIPQVERHAFAAEIERVWHRRRVDVVAGAYGLGQYLVAVVLLAGGENKGLACYSQRSQYNSYDRQLFHDVTVLMIRRATSCLLSRGLSVRLPSRPMMYTLLVSTPKPAPLSRSELRTM